MYNMIPVETVASLLVQKYVETKPAINRAVSPKRILSAFYLLLRLTKSRDGGR